MPTITSRQNPLVARYRAAARGDLQDLLLLDGAHLVTAALDAGLRLQHTAVGPDASSRAELRALLARLADQHVDVAVASAAVMDALSPVRSSSAIVALAGRPVADQARLYAGATALVVIASDVQDPGNLGAIVRVAEAAGATGVVAAGACADPFGWKALRGSMGSALRLPVAAREHVDQAVSQARRRGCRIVATIPKGGRSLFDVDFTKPSAVLVGGEGAGLTRALIDAADERVTIPMQPPVESLNAAVTAALILYEALRQRTRNPEPRTQNRT